MSDSPAQPSLFAAPEGQYVRVALDTPVRREFSYWAPSDQPIEPGARVRVPFGSRQRVGVVVGIDPHPPVGVDANRVRPITALLDAQPLLTPALLRLARTIADHNFCSWGNALAAMLPATLRRGRARRTITHVELVRESVPPAADLEVLAGRYPKQEKAIAYLERAGGPVELREFLNRSGLSRSPLDTLRKKGWVRFSQIEESGMPFADEVARDQPPQLTDQQRLCVDALCESIERREVEHFLLFGVTGSGKTEVYLHALERCLEQGRGGIVLVPEISLTPQTVARFRARCGEVAVLHSGLTDAERHDQWKAIRTGRVRVVVGARSALFAPVPDLGLIIVDEEHESSFKQESVPRYHARDVALERARLEGAVSILGSATPSLEIWHAAKERRSIRLLELPDRVAGGQLPQVQVVDLRSERPEKGHWLVMSAPLRTALEAALERDEKAILFLNRRGYAPAWHCCDCGAVAHCPSCDVPITYHKWRKRALCHICLNEQDQPKICQACSSVKVQLVGVGTERAEEAVMRQLPQARVVRMDRDTMLRRESYEEALDAFRAGTYNVLLGTQMVAKGLDFPDVTVVGVLNADTALHQPDFRASERCFDLVSQVSGRAGRSDRGGKVVVQTFLPDHPSIRHAAHHDFQSFARDELAERREFQYPPFSAAVRITCEAEQVSAVERLAQHAADALRAVRASQCAILGPAPPPVERVRGRVRRQLLIKASPAEAIAELHPVLHELCQKQGIVVDHW
ncbi:MAG: primosomal protein N' [Planctomycetes bacterium]|nr:primosomal protein N' [Planctomycetota bacterium]